MTYFRIKKAANLLGVSVETLKRWDAKGYFSAVYLSPKYKTYPIENIEKYLKNGGEKIKYPITVSQLRRLWFKIYLG